MPGQTPLKGCRPNKIFQNLFINPRNPFPFNSAFYSFLVFYEFPPFVEARLIERLYSWSNRVHFLQLGTEL